MVEDWINESMKGWGWKRPKNGLKGSKIYRMVLTRRGSSLSHKKTLNAQIKGQKDKRTKGSDLPHQQFFTISHTTHDTTK